MNSGETGLNRVAMPVVLLIIAMVSIQSGASFAKSMFPLVGPAGMTALRLFFATVILMAITRPWRVMPTPAGWRSIIFYGVSLGGMNLLFYMSLRTVPLGIAVALEFTGPLAVAILGSRRPADFLWVALALGGIAMLLPIGRTDHGIDPLGAAYALAAGACWALYIIFGQKAGADHGTRTVTWGSLVAAALVVPIGIAHAGAPLFDPAILPMGIAVAILSSAFPYTLEMIALTRLPARVFGTMMSMEPAIGALSGLIFLGEQLSLVQWGAITAIIAASLGAALTISPGSVATPVD